jgi:hypothetical protein
MENNEDKRNDPHYIQKLKNRERQEIDKFKRMILSGLDPVENRKARRKKAKEEAKKKKK